MTFFYCMNLRVNTVICVLGLLLLQPFSAIHAIEPGALTPRKPDYQLPALPNKQASETELGLQIKEPKKKRKQVMLSARFILKAIQFEGNKGLSDKQLQIVAQPFINKAVSLVDLETIRQLLIQHYRQAGYLYPSVILPSQHISQGLVRYQINEGHLVSINITGEERLNENYIRDRINLDSDEPLQQAVLLERFQLLLADPMIERVNGAIKPGANPGETILDLAITRAKPYELYLVMDNYTPPSVGSYTGRVSGIVRNLTGQGDFLQLDFNGSEGLLAIDSYFSIPFTHYDTRFNIGVHASDVKVVDDTLKHLDIKNKFLDVNVGISQPLFRSLNRVFNLELQYAFRQSKTSVLDIPMALSLGVEEDGTATVSVLRFIQSFLDRNNDHVLSMRSSFNFGFDAFNATINQSPIPDGRYFSWQGQLHYIHRLDERGTEIFFRTDLQFASEPLLPLERFALGGVQTVRGYREYEVVRDEGYAMSLEIRYPLLLPGTAYGHQLRIIPFFDFGQAWNKHQEKKSLYSAGIGLNWQWRQFGAEFYWAKALNNLGTVDREYDVQDSGIHFQLHAQIL